MRERLTKKAMGLNDSPTTMHVDHANPPVEKYETGNPDAWAETPNMSHPWDEENAAGREPSGHAKMKSYAAMVKEAKEMEEKALHCLKLAQDMLPDAPQDSQERQAVDFMTMSNKAVLATLRRMREFEALINEAKIAKVVDACLDVLADEKKEDKKEKEYEYEEKKACDVKKEEVKAEEEEKKAEEKKEEVKAEDKIARIVQAVLEVLSEEEDVEKKEEEKKEVKAEEKKEEKKEEAVKAEKKAEEKKEEKKEEEVKEVKAEAKVEEEVKAEEEKKEEVKEANLEISFDEAAEVLASEEDMNTLASLFSAEKKEEEKEEKKEEKKAGVKSLKTVTASKENSEVEDLAKLWKRE